MNKLKKIFLCFICSCLVAGTIFIVVPQLASVTEVSAAAVKLNKTKITLMTGTKYTLKLNVPASQKKNIIWSSQYKNIAAINANGVITAKNKGTTKIRAIFKGKKYFCTVKVEDPKLNKTNITLKVNQEYQLKIGGGISSGKMVKSK